MSHPNSTVVSSDGSGLPRAQRKRVVSGMRPTGRLHLGHLVGALGNWVPLQAQYDCFYFVADWHALTSDYADTTELTAYAYENVADWMGAGLDPEASTFFVQSLVPEHAELYLLLSMVVPVPWLERVPTYKEQQENLKDKDLSSIGFLGYPLLQTADVVIYDANCVPVGEDQVAHLELAREVVRRFNNFYGPVFPEPQTLLTAAPRTPGTDGRKMSKSYGNTIGLREDPASVEKKLKGMVTDPARARRTDPGDPEKCPVWDLHKIYSDEKTQAWVQNGCRTAGIGCLDCKKPVIESILAQLAGFRERAREYVENPELLRTIVSEGCERARESARATMDEVREAVRLDYR